MSWPGREERKGSETTTTTLFSSQQIAPRKRAQVDKLQCLVVAAVRVICEPARFDAIVSRCIDAMCYCTTPNRSSAHTYESPWFGAVDLFGMY